MGAELKNIDRELLFCGGFGLERETLRVDSCGRLAQTPHPFGNDEHLSRDFCENQLEIITPVTYSPQEAVGALAELHRKAAAVLREKNEYLWAFSNPPFFADESEIPIARFSGSLHNKQLYRQYLAKKYGKRKMLFSGIHLNFSFSDKLAQALCKELDTDRDGVYLTLAARLVQHSWLIVLLTAAGSAGEDSFMQGISDYASPRCGDDGYWNDFTPVLELSSLYGYCTGIQAYVNDGQLVSASELYYPVRLKPRGENSLEALLEGGVDHIELRMYDLDPLAPYGIFPEDISFAQLLMLYLLTLDTPLPDKSGQIRSLDKMKLAARYERPDELKAEALTVLEGMEKLFSGLGAGEERLSVIRRQKQKLSKGQSYAELVRKTYGADFTRLALERSKAFTEAE